MEITSRTKLFDLLKAYPELEERIISLAPPFKNLRNPVLRRTVGQLATLEKVAQMGQQDVTELVNSLRRAVGHEELGAAASSRTIVPPAYSAADPDWLAWEPQYVVDGVELLRNGEIPVQHVNELLPSLDPDRYILLVTDFKPTPMLEALAKQGREVHEKVAPGSPEQFFTYIRAA
jgi:hypothetical protein